MNNIMPSIQNFVTSLTGLIVAIAALLGAVASLFKAIRILLPDKKSDNKKIPGPKPSTLLIMLFSIVGILLIVAGTILGYRVYLSAMQPIIIPLNAGWHWEGPGARGNGEYNGEFWKLEADLQGGDSFAEFFLDLRNLQDLPGVKKNSDGSYKFSGMKLITLVSSDQDFQGDPKHLNGVQFLLKNSTWKSLEGPFLPVNSAAMTQKGMQVFFDVHDDPQGISREVIGISIKFTIGSNSKATYTGNFFVKEVIIKKN